MNAETIHRITFTATIGDDYKQHTLLTADAGLARIAQHFGKIADLECEVTPLQPQEMLYSGEASGNKVVGQVELCTIKELQELGVLNPYQAGVCEKQGQFSRSGTREVHITAMGRAGELMARQQANEAPAMTADPNEVERLCKGIFDGAEQHAEGTSEADHEVGDLQDAFRVLAGQLGPDQLEAVQANPAIKGITAGWGPGLPEGSVEIAAAEEQSQPVRLSV